MSTQHKESTTIAMTTSAESQSQEHLFSNDALSAAELSRNTSAWIKTQSKWEGLLNGYCTFHVAWGWKDLVAECLDEIKTLEIENLSPITIVESFGEMLIEIEYIREAQLNQIRERCEPYRLRSQRTCMECGGEGSRRIFNETVIVQCRSCRREAEAKELAAANIGKVITGTWLDKF